MTITVTDGGTGTELIARGYAGSSLDAWNEAPAILRSVHVDFVQAGADLIVASTFLASARSSSPCLRGEFLEAIRQSIAIARSVIPPAVHVAASLGPGTIDRAIVEACAGADLLFLETMVRVKDADHFLGVARDAFAKPIYVSFAIDDAVKSYGGDSLEAIAAWTRDARPDAAGFNCGTGTAPILAALAKVGGRFTVPLIARPAASSPGGEPESPQAFSAFAREALRLGAAIVGGCCGAGPAHVAAIAAEVAKHRVIG